REDPNAFVERQFGTLHLRSYPHDVVTRSSISRSRRPPPSGTASSMHSQRSVILRATSWTGGCGGAIPVAAASVAPNGQKRRSSPAAYVDATSIRAAAAGEDGLVEARSPRRRITNRSGTRSETRPGSSTSRRPFVVRGPESP